MGSRGVALSLMLVGLVGVGCGGGDDESASIDLEKQIGAPGRPISPSGSSDGEAAVAKAATIEMRVPREDLGSSARSIVDMATSDAVGGFLVSSVIDRTRGSGSVVVKVPAVRFEDVVGDLGSIGDIRRQELEGTDLSPEVAEARAETADARSRAAVLTKRLEQVNDPGKKFDLRQELSASRNELRDLDRELDDLAGTSGYSVIEVALAIRQPPPPPEKPLFSKALSLALSLTGAIGAGIVLSAAVILPIGGTLLIVYLLALPMLRRARQRLQNEV